MAVQVHGGELYLRRYRKRRKKINFYVFHILGNIDHFSGSFRYAIWPLLSIGQCFGALPVTGFRSRWIFDLQFKWTSFRTIYSLAIGCILSAYSILLIWQAFNIEVELFLYIGMFLLFYLNCCIK